MNSDKRLLAFLILIFLAIIWGSSFILMKRGLEHFTPPQVASIRLTVAWLCLLPFAIGGIKKIPKKKWKFIAVSGIFGNGIPAFLFTAAQTTVSSALAGILNSITSLFTMLLGYLFFQTKFTLFRVLGVLIGFGGTIYLVTSTNQKVSGDVPHILLIVLATLFYATSVNVIRHRLSEIKSIHIAGFALFFAGPPAAVYLFTTDFIERISSGGSPALMSFMYVCLLAIFGTSISIVIFNYLIKISGALFAASCTYLIPVVAILWAYADNEVLDISLFIGMAMILFGVYLIGRK